jgi:hypothetical protein
MTAVKSPATGMTMLLATEEAKQYEKRLSEYNEEFQPATAIERILVEGLASNEWRLARIARIEDGLALSGRREFGGLFEAYPPEERERLLAEKMAVEYAKLLKLLKQQRKHLEKYRQKDLEELRRMQYERAQNEMAKLERAAKAAGRLIVFPKSKVPEGLQ